MHQILVILVADLHRQAIYNTNFLHACGVEDSGVVSPRFPCMQANIFKGAPISFFELIKGDFY